MYSVSQILTVSYVLMKKIGFVTQKGGAGKSTSAVTLAGALAQKHRVALVDFDPQGSIARWIAVAKLPKSLEIFAADRISDLKALEGFDYAVIDTKGELSADALPALDLALVPCLPSLFDIWSTADSIEVMKAHQNVRPEFRIALYVNCLDETTILSREITEALNGYDLPVVPIPLHDWTGYPNAIARGKTPATSPNSNVRLESLRFAEAVKKILEA